MAVAIGLSGLLWFRASSLSSIGLAGAIVVLCSVGYALTFLPALLGMLGPRVNALSVDGLLRALRIRLDKEGRIDWDLWHVDGSNVRAARAAAGAGKKGAKASPRTTRWAAREAGGDPSSTWSLTVTPFPWPPPSRPGRSTNRHASPR